MSEILPFPLIDPNTFDLIVVGTGLPESIIAAAVSDSGKSVIHLDVNPFYGSHFASLTLQDLTSFLNSQSTHHDPSSVATDDPDLATVDITTRCLYSDVEISSYAPEIVEEYSRKFNLDVAGPRVLFCADEAIDLIIKSGTNQYIEFKSIDASFVYDESGKLWNVPDSREAIFKDKSLGLMEKNQLMRFFKLVQKHLDSGEGEESDESARISEEDLEAPFVDFLKKMRLPQKLKSIILYAICMVDYDQDDVEVCKDKLKTRDAIARMALYHASVGRLTNAHGALIYPIYGQGELPQAFCRRAAVKGCVNVLRMPVTNLLMEKGSGQYKGIRLASGQDLFSQKLVLDPSFTSPLPRISSLSDTPQESLQVFSQGDVKAKVARGIYITSTSLKPDISNFLVIFPPRSLGPEQVTSIRALQLGGSLAVCPSGMYVLYLSTLCEDANQGKRLIHGAVNALLPLLDSGSSEISTAPIENIEVKPTLLWSALYNQELTMSHCGSISSTPMPDGNLNYSDLLASTAQLFQKLYPNEEFFPETMAPKNSEDDDGCSVESSDA